MIFRRSYFLILISAFPLLLSFYSQQWKGTIKQDKGVEIIENPSLPIFEETILELMPDFIIPCDDKKAGYLFFEITDIAVDQRRFIYIYDRKASTIFIFNEQGIFVRKIGRSGSGPGELDGVSEIEVANHHLYALGSAGMRIHVFDEAGTYKNTLKTPGTLSSLRANETGLFFARLFDRQFYSIIHFGPDKNILRSFGKENWEKPRFWQNILSYEISPIGDVIVGDSSDYKLFVFTIDGRHKKTITKKFEPIKIPNSELNYLKNKNAGLFEIPTYYDPFWLLFVDDEGRIIVNTHIFLAGPEKAFYDLFSPEGKYLSTFSLDYYKKLIWKGNHLYAVSEDNEGFPIVKVFKVRWKTE